MATGGGRQVVMMRYRAGEGRNEGLQLLDTSECDVCCSRQEGSPVVLMTSDGKRRRANVTVFPSTYTVVAWVDVEEGVRVVGLQYNFDAYPQCSIYNGDRLPQLPMRLSRYGVME